MCVLLVADKRRPTEIELEKMALQNPDGAGIAWRDTEKGHKVVKWEKGLTLDQMKVYCTELPLPFVGHFRIGTCGGKIPEMTHPFPVERNASLALIGQIEGYVLFHNGHWGAYKDRGLDGAIKNKVKVPDGKWSDTRVMAWLAHLHGHAVLEFIDEKVILFGSDKIEIFHPDGWSRVNDLLVSNRIWETRFVGRRFIDEEDAEWFQQLGSQGQQHGPRYPKLCSMSNCHEDTKNLSYYCAEHQPSCRFLNCQEKRLPGSENCAQHQPPCIEHMCRDPRVIGEKLCAHHLAIKVVADQTAEEIRKSTETKHNRISGVVAEVPPARSFPVPDVKQPGGAGAVVPFPDGLGVVQRRENHQGSAEPVSGHLGGVNGHQLPEADAVVEAGRRWAAPMNIRNLILSNSRKETK